VYGLHSARFLADRDEPDRLVLSLYGQLAAGMTRGTFVSGEAATLTPVRDGYRAMYLPPNATSNAAFLEKLRLTLVHETANGLQLAFATPRAWLAPGKRIAVHNAPTRFGPVSYELRAENGVVHATLEVPKMPSLRLRLRLPHSTRTIDLSGRSGTFELSLKTARGGR
jgi:hypothetical protein